MRTIDDTGQFEMLGHAWMEYYPKNATFIRKARSNERSDFHLTNQMYLACSEEGEIMASATGAAETLFAVARTHDYQPFWMH